jgi:hypothetical protein
MVLTMRTMATMPKEKALISQGFLDFVRERLSLTGQCQCGALPLSYAPPRDTTVEGGSRLVGWSYSYPMARSDNVRHALGFLYPTDREAVLAVLDLDEPTVSNSEQNAVGEPVKLLGNRTAGRR